ncbi:MAG: DNA polymerase I [Phycisphaerales bacterium]|nr:MAG: DNA polymerase I [Phycisphaerales bacterium]
MPKTLYLIDGHAQIYRAYYAPFRELTSPTGEPTKATSVFCQMLLKLLTEKRPDYLAVVLDSRDETVFRCDIYPDYKKNRDPAPEDLHVQADRIISIVEAMAVPTFRLEGFEADDLIATIAERLKGEDVVIYAVSKDKDLEQLMSDRFVLYDAGKDAVFDTAALIESKGYPPEKAVEIQTLTGDTTDNVPGVHGIGPKKAAALIEQYGTAEAVLAHADELTPKMAENVRAFAPLMPVARQLVTLRRDVPFEFDLQRCRTELVQPARALPIFESLGFTRLRHQVMALAGGGDPRAAGGPSDGFPRAAVDSGGAAAPQTLFDDAPLSPPPEAARVEPAVPLTRRDYTLVDTPEKLKHLRNELMKRPRFAFDTETTGLNAVAAQLCGVSLSWQAGTGFYVPVRGIMGPVLPEGDVVAALKPIFENDKSVKVGHNLKYDLLVLRQAGIEVAGPMFDTMVASFLLDPMRRSHSLDGLSLELFGFRKIPTHDLIGKGKDQITFAEVDTSRACEYACEDVDYTWRIMEVLEPQLAGTSIERLFYETEMPLVNVLTGMEHRGVSLDADALHALSIELDAQMAELRTRVCDAAGHDFNVDSTKQLAVVLFDELKLGVVRTTKTGRSTDGDTLETLARQTNSPIPALVLQYRELAKLKNTYVDTLPKMVLPRTGRIHTSFHVLGAATGRLSSSDPNLQNIPIRTPTGKRIRAAFVPQKDTQVLLAADYSQIELRVLAHYCRDAALLRAFQEGVDIHRFVAAQVHGVELDAVTPEQRSAAKAVNFGIIYGQTAFGLARGINVSVSEARSFIDRYFRRYPGIRRFIDSCTDDARRTGYAQTILGRRRAIPELHSRNPQQRALGERVAVNTVIQGSAADMIKRAMVDIDRELARGGYSARMLIQVHDELVFEVDRASVEREADMIRRKMIHAIPLDVPVVVDVGWGRNWLECK